VSGRNVLVTGGSSGIGREVVDRFARAGDTVWFTYLHGAARAKDVVERLTPLGFDVRAFAFDQGDWDSQERLFEELPGPVEVLINNAAVGSATVSGYAPGAAYQRSAAMLQINSLGPLWLTERALPGMRARGYGKIVNVSSVGGGIAPFPYFDRADGMSKAALVHLTRQLAVEMAHEPVDVFAVCPGAVETPMLAASVLDQMSPQSRSAFVAELPKQRLISADEVAQVVWWLCSEPASILHGAVLDASLGLGLAPGMFRPDAARH
jgi:NAD(P)-dependent dehydrogenase (short-subunit alcohol dehydrogenase family)